MMRKIDLIIVHCTDTPAGRDVTVEDVRRWHRAQGWSDIGYHWLVRIDGRVEQGRSEAIAGAHCKGLNSRSIGVVYAGGRDKDGRYADTRTPEQKRSLARLLREIRQRYGDIEIHGHNEYAAKACPCFNAYEEYRSL